MFFLLFIDLLHYLLDNLNLDVVNKHKSKCEIVDRGTICILNLCHIVLNEMITDVKVGFAKGASVSDQLSTYINYR